MNTNRQDPGRRVEKNTKAAKNGMKELDVEGIMGDAYKQWCNLPVKCDHFEDGIRCVYWKTGVCDLCGEQVQPAYRGA
jgi:hypothetical protein